MAGDELVLVGDDEAPERELGIEVLPVAAECGSFLGDVSSLTHNRPDVLGSRTCDG